jgi:hypothetical protein
MSFLFLITETVLHWACGDGILEICERLIAAGAWVNAEDRDYHTTVYYVGSCGQDKIVSPSNTRHEC